MPNFACLATQSGESAPFGCACPTCQDAVKPLAAPEPGPAPASLPGDIPGDMTSTASIAVGTQITGALEVTADHDWYAVDLVAGTAYLITLDGFAFDEFITLEDPYIYLRDANGVLLDQDDDNGPGRYSLLNWTATATGRYFLDVGAWEENYVGGYRLAISAYDPQIYSLDQIADFLTMGYWGDAGHRWDTSTDNIITYNITALTVAGQTLARAAFQTWANVTNLVFQEVETGGDIPFDDSESGAFAAGTWAGGLITSMRVNISTGWLAIYGTDLDSYSFQTYVHEIGHALGLGHAGPYNGSATYGQDNLYLNDVWSTTIMSYFDQAEASFGSKRFVMGPSIADVLAVHDLYGANTSFNAGNNVYGHNANSGSLYDFANYTTAPAFCIYDTGGADTLDASGYGANQVIDLWAEAFSSIGGLIKNIAIARDVIIEAAIAGDGADSIIGNAADNMLSGNAGADTLTGGAGSDSLYGDAGNDMLMTDGIGDFVEGGAGDDVVLLGGVQLADILALFAITT